MTTVFGVGGFHNKQMRFISKHGQTKPYIHSKPRVLSPQRQNGLPLGGVTIIAKVANGGASARKQTVTTVCSSHLKRATSVAKGYIWLMHPKNSMILTKKRENFRRTVFWYLPFLPALLALSRSVPSLLHSLAQAELAWGRGWIKVLYWLQTALEM